MVTMPTMISQMLTLSI